mmetsp:Transcript_36702/g.87641  ORF Transcript_36702/g.87641 Transcript_36702/m.87641 type:complete len:85 (-) Transcript_36702:1322-1576(-)
MKKVTFEKEERDLQDLRQIQLAIHTTIHLVFCYWLGPRDVWRPYPLHSTRQLPVNQLDLAVSGLSGRNSKWAICSPKVAACDCS